MTRMLKTSYQNPGDMCLLFSCCSVVLRLCYFFARFILWSFVDKILGKKDITRPKAVLILCLINQVYPVWKWFEKQDGIRSLQKNSKDPAPEFYNIYLERPKVIYFSTMQVMILFSCLFCRNHLFSYLKLQGDRDGYDLVVVDAMHKANYASRICHSCHPNCEAK